MNQLLISAFEQFDRKWALVTAGDAAAFNTMTISWGGLGTLWSRPVATVYVRPSRYTYEFMEKNEYFTVSFFPEQYRKALTILGSLSGRDGDKVKAAGLTPKPVEGGMTFAEAEVTLRCRKLYRQDLDPTQIPEDVRAQFYDGETVHRMYIGEVVELTEG